MSESAHQWSRRLTDVYEGSSKSTPPAFGDYDLRLLAWIDDAGDSALGGSRCRRCMTEQGIVLYLSASAQNSRMATYCFMAFILRRLIGIVVPLMGVSTPSTCGIRYDLTKTAA